MFDRLISEIRTAPELLNTRGAELLGELKTAPEKLAAGREKAARWAKVQMLTARGNGESAFVNYQADALEGISAALEKAGDMPYLSQLAAPAKSLLDDFLESLLAPSIDGFDGMNVKSTLKLIRDLSRIDLIRLRRYEATHKNRKTVLDALDREFERRLRTPEATE